MLNLLLKVGGFYSSLSDAVKAVEEEIGTGHYLADFLGAIVFMAPYALMTILSVGMVYFLIMGVTLAKTEDSGKREEAKKRMVNAIVGFGIVLSLILFLQFLFIPNMQQIFNLFSKTV